MKVAEISGGVGGARLARGLSALPDVHLTLVVNVGDDDRVHGLHVSADLDTVVYTLAGVEGSEGWGRDDDTFACNDELGRFGVDNRFRLGDRDLALNLYRTMRLDAGDRLSAVTADIARSFGIRPSVIPVTDDPLRTEVLLDTGWVTFQDYFVLRQNRDTVLEVAYRGAPEATLAPGVADAIQSADMVVIAPSNPPLSVWPVLAVPGMRDLIADHPRVVAMSPLFGGKALKGPADRVMASLGMQPGSRGIAEAYSGLIDTLIVDTSDATDRVEGVDVVATDTRIAEPEAAQRFAGELVAL